MTEENAIVVVHDDISNRLDEMADLCEHWKKWRQNTKYTPTAIRSALVMLSGEVSALHALEKIHGPRTENLK